MVEATISRVYVHAKPASNHRDYDEWETANVVVLVQASDRETALTRAREVLQRHCWEIIALQLCDQLIEDRVREQGGEMWKVYQQAQVEGEGAAIKIFPRHFAPGPGGIPAIRAPRVTEAFIDVVVEDVGGVRLQTDDESRIADYRIGEWLFELKDLQQEGLLRPERQEKLAALFAPYAVRGEPLRIDSLLLNDDERRRYLDILSGPIQHQVKSASKQIRSTKEVLGEDDLRGGLIYLNTGYGSFPPDQFGPLVDRYVRKDTTQIDAVFCVSTWSVTNGFDSQIFFRTYPSDSEFDVVRRLQQAFASRFEEAMTQLVTGMLAADAPLAAPLTPVTFARCGLDFAWEPPTIPLPWDAAGGTQ